VCGPDESHTTVAVWLWGPCGSNCEDEATAPPPPPCTTPTPYSYGGKCHGCPQGTQLEIPFRNSYLCKTCDDLQYIVTKSLGNEITGYCYAGTGNLIDNSYCNYCGKIGGVKVPIEVNVSDEKSNAYGTNYDYYLTVAGGYTTTADLTFTVSHTTWAWYNIWDCSMGTTRKEQSSTIPAGTSGSASYWNSSCSSNIYITDVQNYYPGASFRKDGKLYKYCSWQSQGYFYCHKSDI
jgi:hypothetical protein